MKMSKIRRRTMSRYDGQNNINAIYEVYDNIIVYLVYPSLWFTCKYLTPHRPKVGFEEKIDKRKKDEWITYINSVPSIRRIILKNPIDISQCDTVGTYALGKMRQLLRCNSRTVKSECIRFLSSNRSKKCESMTADIKTTYAGALYMNMCQVETCGRSILEKAGINYKEERVFNGFNKSAMNRNFMHFGYQYIRHSCNATKYAEQSICKRGYMGINWCRVFISKINKLRKSLRCERSLVYCKTLDVLCFFVFILQWECVDKHIGISVVLND